MPSITRRDLIIASTLTALTSRASVAATPVASPIAMDDLLGPCGMNYDLGAELSRGELTRPASDEQFYRNELTAIRDQLHCQSVGLYGSVPDQLIAGLNIAADLGFDIRLQNRFNFLPETEMVDRLLAVAHEAERVRLDGIPIVLDVGCEYLIFADGLLPGDDIFEKIDAINAGSVDWVDVFQRYAEMLALLADSARSVFGGRLTYSDTPGDPVLWEAFDIIGIDHYISSETIDTYVETIDALAATGKPVWVNEFGSPPWRGASAAGGMAWDIVDYEAMPPQIIDGIVRDEDEQARVILETLGLIERSQAERAYLYEFITVGSTRSDDPRYDYDLTGYGIVSLWGADSDLPYETTGFWEPKVAFHELAAWNLTR